MQKERGNAVEDKLPEDPEASAGGGCQWLLGEGQARKLAELAVCRLHLEGWGKSRWILLFLPFSGGISPQPCEMLLAVTWRLSGDRRWLDKPEQSELLHLGLSFS